MAKKIRCPGMFCRSKDWTPITASQNFKIGKGIVGGSVGRVVGGVIGGAIGGPAGLAAIPLGATVGMATGFNGKRKVKFVCNKCGKIFTAKV